MIQLPLTLGFTQREGKSYIPLFDGYRSGASQVVVELGLVDVPGLTLGEPVTQEHAAHAAEQAWIAMNAPAGVQMTALAGQIRDLLITQLTALHDTDHDAWQQVHTLQPGDTATLGEVTVVCMKIGWEQAPAC